MITHQLGLRNAQDYSLNVHFFSYLKVLVCYKTISIIQGVFRLGIYVCLKTCRVLKVIVYYYWIFPFHQRLLICNWRLLTFNLPHRNCRFALIALKFASLAM